MSSKRQDCNQVCYAISRIGGEDVSIRISYQEETTEGAITFVYIHQLVRNFTETESYLGETLAIFHVC